MEAVRGAVVELARRGRVDAQYVVKHGRAIRQHDPGKLLTQLDLRRILQPVGKLPYGSFYLEWAVTTRGKFLFYRLTDLASEGRALLAKYSQGEV